MPGFVHDTWLPLQGRALGESGRVDRAEQAETEETEEMEQTAAQRMEEEIAEAKAAP